MCYEVRVKFFLKSHIVAHLLKKTKGKRVNFSFPSILGPGTQCSWLENDDGTSRTKHWVRIVTTPVLLSLSWVNVLNTRHELSWVIQVLYFDDILELFYANIWSYVWSSVQRKYGSYKICFSEVELEPWVLMKAMILSFYIDLNTRGTLLETLCITSFYSPC